MKLPNKIKLTIAVALVASGLWLLKPQQDKEYVVAAQAPTVEAPVHFDSAVHYDSAVCLLYTSPSPRDATLSRMPSSA